MRIVFMLLCICTLACSSLVAGPFETGILDIVDWRTDILGQSELNQELIDACRNGDFEKVEELGGKPTSEEDFNGPLKIVKKIGKEKDPDKKKKRKWYADVHVETPEGNLLHIAAGNGHTKIVKYLLEKGVSPSEYGENNYQPVHVAAEKGYIDIVSMLLDNPKSGFKNPQCITDLNLLDKIRLLVLAASGENPRWSSERNPEWNPEKDPRWDKEVDLKGNLGMLEYLVNLLYFKVDITDNMGHSLLHHFKYNLRRLEREKGATQDPAKREKLAKKITKLEDVIGYLNK